MGEVWKGTHRMLARSAAVKLIQPEVLRGNDRAASVTLKRFEREAQATAALRSAHTVELFDFGVSRDGTFYYVMELLDGLDLWSLVERYGPQPPERVVTILRQACHSLHEAHVRGLIHRDIKPANIFLCRYGVDLDFVKVLDFGLVSAFEADPEEARLTQAGMVSGTPAFISPEAALGDQSVVDGRSDLYGLGCVMYWLLTGRTVFEKPSAMAMVVAHVNDKPAAISELMPLEVPEGLEKIVMQLLEKNPDNRPQTALELSVQLRDVDIEKLWTIDRAVEWWERHSGDAPVLSHPTMASAG
jgi:serine/threonine-protein kinase